MPIRLLSVVVAAVAVAAGSVPAARGRDWPDWRGPDQNRHYEGPPLATSFDPEASTNVLWKNDEAGGISTPVILGGKLFTLVRHKPGTREEAEKVLCLDAASGRKLWENVFNVYLSDVPSERVGWSAVIADPDTNTVFAHGVCGVFTAIDAATGQTKWQRSLHEEFGFLSTYGGRTNIPVVFEDLVIASAVVTGWGDTARPAHRFLGMDKSSGEVRWMNGTKELPEDTTYSTPSLATLGGEAALVFGSSDGSIWNFQPRTGKAVWNFKLSRRGLNVAPLVDGDSVYVSQAEENLDNTSMGSVTCFKGVGMGDITATNVVWQKKGVMDGRSMPVVLGDRVYFVDDGGAMFGVNAKTGEVEVEKKLGRIMFGSLVVSEGKMYIGENSGVIHTLKPTATSIESLGKTSLRGNEVFGSFAISNGRLYLPTTTALYCIGKSEIKVDADPMPKLPVEPMVTDKTVAHIQACPVELLLSPGQKAKLQVRAYNASGQYLRLLTDATITIEGGGSVSDDQIFTAPTETTGSAFYITATSGELKSIARGRVIPALPWKFDFEDKKVPLHWIGAAYRHLPFELPTSGNGLVKISTIPKGVRSQAFLGKPNVHDYTVQAEVYATDTKNKVPTTKLPDMGVVNQRYTLALEGSQKLQIRSWVSLGEQRFAKTIPFDWQANTWYTVKLRSENKDGKAVLQGKVWKTGEAEPEAWTIEGEDALPNTVGSPGLFGNSTDAEIYIDNVSVTAN